MNGIILLHCSHILGMKVYTAASEGEILDLPV